MSDSGKSQAVIGAFVVGAVMLLVIGVIVFGGGKMFRNVDHYVMYFEGKGLNIGAPVTFRGVRIGSVTDITLRANPVNLEIRIPVVIEIEEDRIEKTVNMPKAGPEGLKRLIDKGLRAKLAVQSIVTGQLQIDLEFLPDEPVRLSGVKHRYMEIPTVPTTFERFAKKLEQLPIEDIARNASASLEALKNLLNNPALADIINHLNEAMANLQELTVKLSRKANPLVDSFKQLVDHSDQLILNAGDQVQALAAAADRIGRAADAIARLSDAAQPAVDKAGQVFSNLAEVTGPHAKERYKLGDLLKELSAAGRSIRVLADYLEQHPEALIYGKSGSTRR
jgi:paraquat-inducible protein B